MRIFTPDSRMSDIILSHPDVIPSVNRFGIKLGVGQSSVQSICKTYGVNSQLLLAVVNTYVNPDYFPEEELMSIPLPELIGYLTATDHYYSNVLLPNIRRHFLLLVQRSPEESAISLNRMLTFFDQISNRLLNRINEDAAVLYPSLVQEQHGEEHNIITDDVMVDTDRGIADSLSDLISLFVIHLKGSCDDNICYAVINALLMLERDLRQNNRIRDRVLRPLIN